MDSTATGSTASMHTRTRRELRVAVVQFDPKIGQVEQNIALASKLCSKIVPRSVDIVCLPEMCFTGYNFPSSGAILPYLEPPYSGPTSLFCKQLAKRLQCHVVAGYPERLQPDSSPTINPATPQAFLAQHEPSPSTAGPDSPRRHNDPLTHALGSVFDPEYLPGANSAVLYTPTGEALHNYRKFNLYETDLTWSILGTGFISFDLPVRSVTTDDKAAHVAHDQDTMVETLRVSLAICMDLNPFPLEPDTSDASSTLTPSSSPRRIWAPRSWSVEEGPYELADYCVQEKSDVLILLNAWLDSGIDEDEDEDDSEDEENPEPNWSTLRYWGARLRPLWGTKDVDPSPSSEAASGERDSSDSNGEGHETIVVMCNRTGTENGTTFAGSSAIYSMKQGFGRPKLLGYMGRKEEGVKVWKVLV